MSTSIDVYKIPAKYKNLDCYENVNLEYEDEKEDYENLIFTIGGFDCSNIITGLFNLKYSKLVPWSGNDVFNGKYIITLEEFLKAKSTYTKEYNKTVLIKEYGIEDEDFDYIHEELVRFFTVTEPIIEYEKKYILV